MKEKLLQNMGLKLISLVFAAILWIVIVNIEDPVETKKYTAVTVTVQNESIITNDGKMYQIVNNTGTVEVTVSAKRSVLQRIQRTDILLVADIENLQLNSLIPIEVTIPAYEGRYETATANPTNVEISIEDVETVKFPLTAELTGTLRDGYFAESMTVTPDNVTISGPKSVITSITSAVAKADASGLSEDANLSATLVLYDSSGGEVEQTLLTTNLGTSAMTVSVHVMEALDIPISVQTSGRVAEGYVVAEVTCEPSSIRLTGKEEVVNSLPEEIVLPSVDIDGKDETVEQVVDLADYLPEGVSLADSDDAKVLITVTIEEYGTKTILYPTGSIVVENAPSGYEVTYPDETEISLKVQAPQEELAALDASDTEVRIDLAQYNESGEYEVPFTVIFPDGSYTLSGGTETVRIRLETAKTNKTKNKD